VGEAAKKKGERRVIARKASEIQNRETNNTVCHEKKAGHRALRKEKRKQKTYRRENKKGGKGRFQGKIERGRGKKGGSESKDGGGGDDTWTKEKGGPDQQVTSKKVMLRGLSRLKPITGKRSKGGGSVGRTGSRKGKKKGNQKKLGRTRGNEDSEIYDGERKGPRARNWVRTRRKTR